MPSPAEREPHFLSEISLKCRWIDIDKKDYFFEGLAKFFENRVTTVNIGKDTSQIFGPSLVSDGDNSIGFPYKDRFNFSVYSKSENILFNFHWLGEEVNKAHSQINIYKINEQETSSFLRRDLFGRGFCTQTALPAEISK